MIVLEDELYVLNDLVFQGIYNFMIIVKINNLCNLSFLQVKGIYSKKNKELKIYVVYHCKIFP